MKQELTPRQGQILALITQGLLNKEIAFTLGICEGTVKEHVFHLLKKLNLSNRTQLAVWYVRRELSNE